MVWGLIYTIVSTISAIVDSTDRIRCWFRHKQKGEASAPQGCDARIVQDPWALRHSRVITISGFWTFCQVHFEFVSLYSEPVVVTELGLCGRPPTIPRKEYADRAREIWRETHMAILMVKRPVAPALPNQVEMKGRKRFTAIFDITGLPMRVRESKEFPLEITVDGKHTGTFSIAVSAHHEIE